jgi:hypothetical protein
MPWLGPADAEEDVATQQQCRGSSPLRSLQAFRVKYARVCMVQQVDALLFEVHFHPVVCRRPGKQTVMIVEGGYSNDFPSRLVCAYGLPTEFAQVVYDLHNLERATLHLWKACFSDVDSHCSSGLSTKRLVKCKGSPARVDWRWYKNSRELSR